MRELDFDNLSEDDKEWLRNWNRGDEIPGESDDAAAAEPSADDGYDSWTVPQLKQELENRELPVSGNKPELVSRLEEDDAEDDGSDDSDDDSGEA